MPVENNRAGFAPVINWLPLLKEHSKALPTLRLEYEFTCCKCGWQGKTTTPVVSCENPICLGDSIGGRHFKHRCCDQCTLKEVNNLKEIEDARLKNIEEMRKKLLQEYQHAALTVPAVNHYLRYAMAEGLKQEDAILITLLHLLKENEEYKKLLAATPGPLILPEKSNG